MLRSCKPRWTVAFPHSLDAMSRDVEQAFDQLVSGASQFVRGVRRRRRTSGKKKANGASKSSCPASSRSTSS